MASIHDTNKARKQGNCGKLMQRPRPSQIRIFQSLLLVWFDLNARRFPWRCTRATIYIRVLSEVLLQRTRAETVAAFLPGFIQRFSSWQALANCSEEELGRQLQPLGLWRRRSASLLLLARALATRHGRFPTNRGAVEALPGVGQYVANAICMFALHRAEPLLDVNMARVLERNFGRRKLVDIRCDPRLQEVSRLAIAGPHAMRINWAILDLASLICTTTNPRCIECPLVAECHFARSLRVSPRRCTAKR